VTSETSSRVAVVYTSAPTVLSDIARAMHLAGYEDVLPRDVETMLKINISWQRYYPACSTTPWQLEGVIRTLRRDGYEKILPIQNGTVVVKSHEGEAKNKHKLVLDRLGLESLHLTDKDVPWIDYKPKGDLLVLDKVYPKGLKIPEALIGKSVIHLPTLKTHVFTTMTGAMKNAFGGLLGFQRHWTHSVIHETLVDLLMIQKEIHPGIFAVMDGTIAGDGPGPRTMRPYVKNLLIAGADQVAVDATAAKLMGFDPMSLKFIRLAHERGLGCGDPAKIDVVGMDISDINFGFKANESNFASRGQKLIYWGPLKPFERLLLRTPIVPWSYFASNMYYNYLWYPIVGRGRVKQAYQTEWGKLFKSY
jgi:uncharacterized protein (DUF362 family)